jgi:hypothetical protein
LSLAAAAGCLWGAVWGYRWGRFLAQPPGSAAGASALHACSGANGPACFAHFDFDGSGCLSRAELDAALIELPKDAWWLNRDDNDGAVEMTPELTAVYKRVSQSPAIAAQLAKDRCRLAHS